MRAAVRSFLRSEARRLAGSIDRVDPITLAFGEQRKAIECRAKQVALLCSGRAGKTEGAILKWLEVIRRKPGFATPFITLTRQSAKRIAWPKLKELDRRLGLGLKFNEADYIATAPCGSSLHLIGSNREDLVDILRGFAMPLCLIDEAAFFRGGLLAKVIEAVRIRLMDLDGELWVFCTPGYVEAGDFYEITKSAESARASGFELFSWDFFSNPHLPLLRPDLTDAERFAWRVAYAAEQRRLNGWTEDSPAYVREFKGRWVDDPDSRVYKFKRSTHMIPASALPANFHTHPERWTKVLGIDYGSSNAFAQVLWAFEQGNPTVYGLRARKRYGLAPSLCADATKALVDRWGPQAIVGDAAAKGYMDEARLRHALPIELAEKQHKRAFIEFMNDGWRFSPKPRILLVEGDCGDDPGQLGCDEYADELEKLDWDPKYERGHPKYQQVENPARENDACDGGLYGWRRCYAYLEGLPPPASDQRPPPEDGDLDDEELDGVSDRHRPAHRR